MRVHRECYKTEHRSEDIALTGRGMPRPGDKRVLQHPIPIQYFN